LAAASLCLVTAGMLAWSITALDEEPQRWIPRTLGALAVVAAVAAGVILYTEYRGDMSPRMRDVTALALAFAGLALIAWIWVVAGTAWCLSGHACGD
jgi:hypothetical protein